MAGLEWQIGRIEVAVLEWQDYCPDNIGKHRETWPSETIIMDWIWIGYG
jgi:hypothetical protein